MASKKKNTITKRTNNELIAMAREILEEGNSQSPMFIVKVLALCVGVVGNLRPEIARYVGPESLPCANRGPQPVGTCGIQRG